MESELLDRTLVQCPACLGDGEFYEDVWYYQGNFHSTITHCCEICLGSGQIEKWEAEELEPVQSHSLVEEF